VFFSAVVLYLSFRIRENFSKGTSRAKITQTAFLIGILFLAGAILYYSAASLTSPGQTLQPTPTATPTNQPSPTLNPSFNPTISPTPEPTTHDNQPTPTQSPTPTTSSDPSQPASFTAFYPSTTSMGSQITLTFTIINPSSTTYRNGLIQTDTLFQSFTPISSTHTINANIIDVGDLMPGTTTITIQLQVSNSPGTVTDTATLIYQGAQNQPVQQITILVRGK